MRLYYDELACLLQYMGGFTYNSAIRLTKYYFKKEIDEGINFNIDINAIKHLWTEYTSDTDFLNAFKNVINICGRDTESQVNDLINSLEYKTIVLTTTDSMNHRSYLVENF